MDSFFKRISKNCLILLVGWLVALSWSSALAQPYPTEFQRVELIDGLKNAVNFEFAPDGRIFIIDRFGEIIIYKPDQQISISAGTIPVFNELRRWIAGNRVRP